MTDELVAAYRHDAHKLHGQRHGNAPETFAGVSVNERVPLGADADAAALSRPAGKPQHTVETHDTHYRLSLIDGTSRYDTEAFSGDTVESHLKDLLTKDDPTTIHNAWLTNDVVAGFNESVHYPYTSLKYHTLLVAALLDNYRAGHTFNDLHLIVDDAETVVPHRTVYAGEGFTLRIDADPQGQPSTQLGDQPARSWASTWSRLSAHPLDVDGDKYDMVLDANLRRIGAWSTALQYIEDFREAFDR